MNQPTSPLPCARRLGRLASLALASLTLAAALAGAGCSDDVSASASATVRPPGVECEADLDCSGDAICVAGICNETSERARLDLRIDPPEFRADLVRSTLEGIEIRAGDQLEPVELGPPVRLQGIVRWDEDDASLGPLAADVVVRASGGTDTYAANERVNATNGRFDIDLPPGTYDILVLPDRTNVPRRMFPGVTIRREDADGSCGTDRLCTIIAFVVPAPSRYVRLQGELYQQTPQLLPIAGARVWAVADEGPLWTTSAVTDADGRFAVFAPPGEQRWRFLVASGDEIRLPSASFEEVLTSEVDAIEGIQLWANDWSRRYRVRGRVVDAAGRAVPDVVVSGRQQLLPSDLDQAALEVVQGADDVRVEAAAVGEDGTFEVDLLPGTYRFEAVCADANCISPEPVVFEVDPATSNLSEGDDGPVRPGVPGASEPAIELTVGWRVPVEGSVRADGDDRPLVGARIDAELVRDPSDAAPRVALDAALVRQSAETDTTGAFAFELLPGTWRFRATPPASEPATPVWEELREIRSDSGPIEPLRPRARGSFTGAIVDATATGIGGATVEAWLIEGDERRALGRVRSDADGAFRFILPDAPR